MSVKAQSLVWDMQCPSEINGVQFNPNHKYVLIAYADHADHNGRNIYPAVPTIAKKTGLVDRSVQRLTHDLGAMGVLCPDGVGPKGTNRWYIPFSAGGDRVSPVTQSQGDTDDKSLGDNPSGDNPSGDSVTPELINQNPKEISIHEKYWIDAVSLLKSDMARNAFEKVKNTKALKFENGILTVSAADKNTAEWLSARITSTVEHMLVGIANKEVSVQFVAVETEP